MARYSAAEALRQVMKTDTESDDDSASEGDANIIDDGDYLPGYGCAITLTETNRPKQYMYIYVVASSS